MVALLDIRMEVPGKVLDDGTMEIDDQMWGYVEKRYTALVANSG